MGKFGALSRGRVRWMLVFALLLFASSAVPVLADSPSESQPTKEDAAALPSPEEISAATEKAEAEEKEREKAREEELASPKAEQEREASRTAYTSLSVGEAQSLLSESFPEQLKELNADPARVLSGLEIEKTLGTYGVRASDGEGGSELIESPIPVETGKPGEEREPVDLSLERSGGDFVPKSPLTEVELPSSASGTIQLPHEVAIVNLPGNGDSNASPFGSKNLFFPNTDTSTDTMVSPVTGGVEVFEQLRSQESPEQFRFDLSIPEGSSLRSDGQGGAEIVDSSEALIAAVTAPSAVDAQGTEVPVTLAIEGDSIVLEVPHRSRNLDYPVLVDPELVENWQWTSPASGDRSGL